MEWEYEAQRLEQRLDFLTTVARLWKHAAITWETVGAVAPDRTGRDRTRSSSSRMADRRAVFDGWLHRAATNYRELIELLETLHRHQFTQPSGSHDSLVEFDRLRTLKEMLIQQIITTCVETCDAARLILASRGVKREEVAALFGEPMDAASVQVLQGVLAGDAKLGEPTGMIFLFHSGEGRCFTYPIHVVASRAGLLPFAVCNSYCTIYLDGCLNWA